MISSIDSILDVQYSPISRLNTLDIHQFKNKKQHASETAYWIIYIHGGAWRDPDIDSKSISHVLPYLTSAASQIEGIASINYRLSPYPGHDSHANEPDRNVKHPAHIEDVLAAICWLQHRYQFRENYTIVGHSAGATLALQAASGRWTSHETTEDYPLAPFYAPLAIAGVAGIYDFQALIDSFHRIPIYREFIEAAFGREKEAQDQASPVNLQLAQSYLPYGTVVLADSEEDGLIDQVQCRKMWDKLVEPDGSPRRVIHVKLHGKHDSIWYEGKEMAKVILHVLESLETRIRV